MVGLIQAVEGQPRTKGQIKREFLACLMITDSFFFWLWTQTETSALDSWAATTVNEFLVTYHFLCTHPISCVSLENSNTEVRSTSEMMRARTSRESRGGVSSSWNTDDFCS